MLAARLQGCAIATMVDIAAAPLDFAAQLGADRIINVGESGEELAEVAETLRFDIGFEATGSPAGLASAIAAVRRGGVLVQVGNLPGGQISVPANAIMARELDLKGTFRFGPEFNEAVDLIVSGAVDVLKLVTAEFPLAAAGAAFRTALDRSRSVKVVLTAD
jgi:L-idonate 5-dehydrogenase